MDQVKAANKEPHFLDLRCLQTQLQSNFNGLNTLETMKSVRDKGSSS